MNDQKTGQMFLLTAAVLIIASIFVGSEIPADIQRLHVKLRHSTPAGSQSRLSLIDSALNTSPDFTPFKYSGGFENPFKSWRKPGKVRSAGGHKNASVPPRNKFALKGILIKDKPLAILENGMGETFIRGVHEKALNQTVIAISENRVVLRDHLGTYELSVEEQ
jgi:hypothetical protein